uniref:Transcriptional regulator, GntR family domain / Aspartate aminotransferase (EC) n=1 Tax=uncultured Thiotrichaceae bacterium TaxID=298394 RepID=A0A6S6RV89_9GAMM|nr:MAG: Transcriptional regulator, GntR family domain / Aspartate aminotransferase (EC [uncultured Thiotrichaceae bacterium]
MMLYQQIARKISESIHEGIYLPGHRLPGVRQLSQQFGVSVSTVVQAQRQLENSGLIEAKARSGYYVMPQSWSVPERPEVTQTDLKPTAVTGQELVLQQAYLTNRPDFIQLGAAVPDPSFMPLRAFQRSLTKTVRQYNEQAASYSFPPGLPAFRQQISRRMHLAGSKVKANEILITNGCQEALSISLQAVAKAGDIIAIESPTFYGLLQVIESLGMQALEIPTDPQTGISLTALELALEQWNLKACVLMPNYSNPLGCIMPDSRKQQLLALAAQHELILIEDDINGDLGFDAERPRTLHSFSQNSAAQVIYCSSFSKTISQGLRTGWMIPPANLFQRAEYLKYVSNLATPTLSQLALTDFLAQGGYERHLRQIKSRYAQQINLFTHAISKHLPASTKVTQPKGGFVLWLEFEKHIDTLQLSQRMLEHKISIAPGQIFSAAQKYRHCLRLNCAHPWTPELEQALILLGQELNVGSGDSS